MGHAIAAELQVLLEGVPLPAGKRELVRYAREQDADDRLLAALRDLSAREYRSLDEVGEELAGAQPVSEDAVPHELRAARGAPPGGDDYTRVPTDTGRVRGTGGAASA